MPSGRCSPPLNFVSVTNHNGGRDAPHADHMKTCTYSCRTAEHVLSRRAFMGTAALSGLGMFTRPSIASELASRQKRLLIVRMAGGLSQLESWDPKPGTPTG